MLLRSLGATAAYGVVADVCAEVGWEERSRVIGTKWSLEAGLSCGVTGYWALRRETLCILIVSYCISHRFTPHIPCDFAFMTAETLVAISSANLLR